MFFYSTYLDPDQWREFMTEWSGESWGEQWPAGPVQLKEGTVTFHNAPVIHGTHIKDSGERKIFASGMQRDVTTGKIDYTLVLDGPMFQRWAEHLTKGALKYEPRNWMKANSDEELQRAREAAFRHFIQWFNGEIDEDHAAAVLFNINECEYIKAQR